MANVGAQLAQSGRKVLMVDFDLEAPGLGTYNFPKPNTDSPGVIEFITDYMETGRAPKVNDYLYHSPGFGEKGGELWIMPAGIQDERYGSKFGEIDWQDLYDKRNGFLLIEDLKKQWENELGVDYVLIDSRTGHSDVVGICTRQLPDSVVLMMFPNMQNLIGLKKITSDIVGHGESPGAKEIQKHFVVSNVPDLDDEDQILEDTFEQFRAQLGYSEPSAIIHRYQSLALLNQDVFSITRPRTRLAEEYRQLTDQIVLYNDEDKEGAKSYLNQALQKTRNPRYQFKAKTVEDRVSTLRDKHSDDAEILFLLAQINNRQGDEEDALELYKEAERCGMNSAELYIAMFRIQDSFEETNEALISAKKVLDFTDVSYFHLFNIARVLSRIASRELSSIENSLALLSMEYEDQLIVARELSFIAGGFAVSEKIIKRINDENGSTADTFRLGKSTLTLGLIREKRFDEAVDVIRESSKLDISELTINEIFNLAMAIWGLEGEPDTSLFQLVVEAEDLEIKDINYTQCLAISYFVIGDSETATVRLRKAKRLASKGSVRGFSAWSYSDANQTTFKKDLAELQDMIEGKDVRPSFLINV